ncbi:2-succinyl-5-enolpyruvyl-6-hydroxy-3-cyclohexene-1-carboxylic-acid synthase [Trinickia dinghuensis]|uniref:2-succinyl-5-enolpyruvyl-6-hydroxy-3-cyclohexene-1-carboxylate synthase n=1 Tax=Trinickia dinghuensis TaxID=2291023 RepID=A0A3D8JUG6_9BURK|nr:2-succinyl-5-enolpyruvyl-6-hydroxy-3-cyclohexene-1-carboxylic-acid synthase [Trinickia dinghuensis]RDU96743.1 2-succinyl-5-enolpyruvyl-6-hydroxy-3-cyclohexene-1-carboxylic-acid synthase [Trinickia dinghuensis]
MNFDSDARHATRTAQPYRHAQAIRATPGRASAPREEYTLNDVWIGVVLDALAEAGVRRVVLCPGGRSALMVLAVHEDARFTAPLVANDERSAAFAVLGMIRAGGEPAAIVTTSGSAVANVVPALTEAHECALPLVLVSCDRPRSLRNTGFGQMIDHIGACRSFTRASVDLPDPAADPASLIALKDTLTDALAASGGRFPGPVHINVPLDGYFDSSESAPVEPELARKARSLPASAGARAAPSRRNVDVQALCARLGIHSAMRALVIAGPDCGVPPDTLRAFVAEAGLPVFADTSSGLRGSGLATVLNGHDALTSPEAASLPPPELVIRFGLAPVMPAVQRYLLAHPCATLKVSRVPCSADYLHPHFEALVAPTRAVLLETANEFSGGNPHWLAAWQAAASAAARQRNAIVDRLGWGELPALRTALAHDGFAFMHLANSTPIRHADLLYATRAKPQAVYSNRGVWGIDGTLGTFVGEAHARGDAGLLLVGDLAFLHDLPALALAQRLATSACLCVINNGGGAIFDFLPLSRRPHYDVAVRNPHAFDAEHIAAGFGLPYALADNIESLRAALDAACAHPGASVVEVRVPPGSALAGMRAVGAARPTAHTISLPGR